MGKCTGTVRGGGKDQITVTDRSSKIAHAMVLRQKKEKKKKQMQGAALALSGLFCLFSFLPKFALQKVKAAYKHDALNRAIGKCL